MIQHGRVQTVEVEPHHVVEVVGWPPALLACDCGQPTALALLNESSAGIQKATERVFESLLVVESLGESFRKFDQNHADVARRLQTFLV